MSRPCERFDDFRTPSSHLCFRRVRPRPITVARRRCEREMQRDDPSRSGWLVGAVSAGVPLALVLFILTGSPVWAAAFLMLLVLVAVIWPREEIRRNLAWRQRSVPLPSWRYWVLFGI